MNEFTWCFFKTPRSKRLVQFTNLVKKKTTKNNKQTAFIGKNLKLAVFQ